MISMDVEVNEAVAAAIAAYLDTHREWDCDRVVNAALSLFLLQNSNPDNTELARVYLEAVFGNAFQAEGQP